MAKQMHGCERDRYQEPGTKPNLQWDDEQTDTRADGHVVRIKVEEATVCDVSDRLDLRCLIDCHLAKCINTSPKSGWSGLSSRQRRLPLGQVRAVPSAESLLTERSGSETEESSARITWRVLSKLESPIGSYDRPSGLIT